MADDPPVVQDPRATKVVVSKDTLTVEMADGRMVEAPIEWFPWLLDASEEAIKNFKIVDDGRQIEWPDLGEKVSLSGMFRGIAALDTN
jgi:hypothetical protein